MDTACALCQRILSSDYETGDLEAISICGDCKFLFLEDIGTPIHDVQRRQRRVRRREYRSPESVENIFSQQFSNIINMARQTQPAVSEHETSVDLDATAARLVQRTSSRTTPSGSSRWRRVLSDTESDGFDSIYGESDSNVSFSAYRLFHGESDTVSFSAYGGDSDASVDGHSLVDNDIFGNRDAESDIDSDTDIDPMHAGVSQWNSDDQEDDDDEWEEADVENIANSNVENIANSNGTVVDLQRSLDATESNVHRNRRRYEGTIRLGIIERRRQPRIPSIFANLAESELQPYAGNSGDYLDARGFEELLEHLAEGDNSRRGAPPAAVSFVNSLPRVIINEEHWKQDSLACAICKDFLSTGTIVNQLPCFHLYHPSCILPWLSARNSCPLCRYELPTDDKEYEDSKQRSRNIIQEIDQQAMNDETSSETSDGGEEDEDCDFREAIEGVNVGGGGESGRGRWFYLAAAAPIVSLVGIVLVMWLGNPLPERRGSVAHSELHLTGRHLDQSSILCAPNRRENRSRRWWSLF